MNVPVFYSLLAYGMMCCLSEHYEEAETFFELATTTDSENIIAWIMTGRNPCMRKRYSITSYRFVL